MPTFDGDKVDYQKKVNNTKLLLIDILRNMELLDAESIKSVQKKADRIYDKHGFYKKDVMERQLSDAEWKLAANIIHTEDYISQISDWSEVMKDLSQRIKNEKVTP